MEIPFNAPDFGLIARHSQLRVKNWHRDHFWRRFLATLSEEYYFRKTISFVHKQFPISSSDKLPSILFYSYRPSHSPKSIYFEVMFNFFVSYNSNGLLFFLNGLYFYGLHLFLWFDFSIVDSLYFFEFRRNKKRFIIISVVIHSFTLFVIIIFDDSLLFTLCYSLSIKQIAFVQCPPFYFVYISIFPITTLLSIT